MPITNDLELLRHQFESLQYQFNRILAGGGTAVQGRNWRQGAGVRPGTATGMTGRVGQAMPKARRRSRARTNRAGGQGTNIT